MLQSQTKKPATVVQDNSWLYGTYDWATISPIHGRSGGGMMKLLKFTGCGFSIPANAQIKGQKIRIKRRSSQNSLDFFFTDGFISITKAGGLGPNFRDYERWLVSDTWKVYGGDTVQLAAGLVPADCNDAGFGFAFTPDGISPEGEPGFADVSDFEITVYYEVP